MSVLEDLYSGNIYPSEHIVPQNKNYRPFSKEAGNLRNYFQQKMPVEDKEKFIHFDQLIQEVHSMECYENFAYGFRLGVLLLLDILNGYEPSEE